MSPDKLIDSDLTRRSHDHGGRCRLLERLKLELCQGQSALSIHLAAADLVTLLRRAQAERDEYQRVKVPEPVDLAAHWTAVCAEDNAAIDAALPPAQRFATHGKLTEDTVAALAAELAKLPPEQRFATMIDMIDMFAPVAPSVSDSERHARAALAEAGIANPSTALLRARLTLGHTKEARDLAHGWPGMLGVHGQTDLVSALDQAETIVMAAYRHLLIKEKLNAC